VHPRQVAEICVEAGMQGYIGGSTIDRLPIEDSVVDATLAFKSAGVALQRERSERGTLLGQAAAVGLHGGSDALVERLRHLQGLADGRSPIVVSGPPGTQRHEALAFARREAGFAAARPTTLLVSDHTEPQLGMRLFGHGDGRQGLLLACNGRPLLIEPLEGLSRRWQRKLARLLQRGMVTPFRGNRAIATRPWLLFVAERPLAALHADGLLIDELHERLAGREVIMPTLAERADALPAILAGHCGARGLDLGFTESAITLLQRRPWPGNVPELMRLIDRLHTAGFTGEITAGALEPFLEPAASAPSRPRRGAMAADEAEWLLSALRRHAFNRTAAARSLGISRKTLYNRMRRLGL
jgi:DNA-binding NtrC family response regulator